MLLFYGEIKAQGCDIYCNHTDPTLYYKQSGYVHVCLEDVHFDIFMFHIIFHSVGFCNAAKEITVDKGINSIKLIMYIFQTQKYID